MSSLGQRLANIANTHKTLKNYKKKYLRNTKTYGFTTVKEFQNYESRKNLENTSPMPNNNTGSMKSIPSATSLVSMNNSNSVKSNTSRSSSCIITPGGQKMKRVNGRWVKCNFGGKRRTRRVTRRRR